MGNFTLTFLIVLSINLMLWLGQFAILSENPTSTTFVDYKGNMFGRTDAADFQLNDSDPYGMLPRSVTSIDPDTGNIFTDIFNSIKEWFANATGAKYLISMLGAPYYFLKALHLPLAFVYAFGTFWYLFSALVTILMFWGRD